MSEAGGNGDPVRESLSRIYEDDDVIVYTAPNEDELKEILLNLLRRHGRMSVKDFHRYLSGLASEDKIRYALSDLSEEGASHHGQAGVLLPDGASGGGRPRAAGGVLGGGGDRV